MPLFQICPSLGMNQHTVKLKLAKGWITQSKYPQVVRKIGLFWQFPQISRPVLAPAGTYTKSGPGPRALSLLCPVGSSPSFITVYSQGSVQCTYRAAKQGSSENCAAEGSSEQQSRGWLRLRVCIGSLPCFAMQCNAVLCHALHYALHRVDGLRYHTL